MRVVKAVEGFFGLKVAKEAEKASLFKRFDKLPASWTEFQQEMHEKHDKAKVVYFVRHAQGTHNAADRAYGPGWWQSEESRTEELLDPDLTPLGVEDTRMKGPPSVKAELERGMPPIERVVVSPLSRAIQTAQNFLAEDQVPHKKFLCMENCREILDCYYFDKRRPLSTIKKKFPDVDFSLVKDEEDLLWVPTHDETQEEMETRARKFLVELFETVPERYVVVVSHLCFIQAVYAVATGTRLGMIDNCEVVPLVLEEV